MKKNLPYILIILLLAAGLFFPFSPGNLHIRLQFKDFTGDHCALYYTTDTSADFSETPPVVSDIDERNQVDFCLDSSLAGHITGLRLDFPETEQLLCINNVSVSSAGIIQKEYDPCYFFDSSNISFTNDISSINLIKSKKRAVIATAGQDPYLLLSPELTTQLQSHFSSCKFMILPVCLFFLCCVLSYKKKLFSAGSENAFF